MKIMPIIFLTLALAFPAMGQPSVSPSREVHQGLNGKTMESCKPDLNKFCSAANLKQECLVAHWTRISSDCQDALAWPMRSGGDGG